ncbi:MAG: T9SS type A sorting domain-containing protein, partial [Planctomycetes bacterium]|nr:T9SS type A sorting domain-containing protein [Planctomycetota bacterium]
EVDAGETSFPITMNFVGDIMLARQYDEWLIPQYGIEAIFDPTLPFFGQAADISVANLECPLSNQGTPHPTKSVIFRGSPENAAGLAYGGIDLVSLANNHTLDYGLSAQQQTQEVLAENNIAFSGAGANSYEAYLPLFYSKSGLTFAFLASSDRTGQYNNYQPYLHSGYDKPGFAYMTPYYLTQQIDAVRDIADLVIVEMHAGSEYSTGPGSDYDKMDPRDPYTDEEYSSRLDVPHMWDIEIRHLAVDAGADLVICHHPHIIQGVELYNGKLIAHSLGNFIFDLGYPETMPSMILDTKIDTSGFYEYSITPIFIDDYIPVRARGELAVHILDHLAMRSKAMNTYLDVDRDSLTAAVVMDTLTMEISPETFQLQIPLFQDAFHRISEQARLQRNGHISAINSISPDGNWESRLGRELIWFGNFEDEGCSLWEVTTNDEWYDETEVYQGDRSLCQRRYPNSGDNIITDLERRIKCYSVETPHILHGYIKTQNAADVTIEVRYYQSRYDYDYEYIGAEDIGVNISGDSEWTFYQKELTPPAETNFINIRLSSDRPDNGVALAWFDNVGISEWTDWQPLQFPQDIVDPNDYYYIQLKTTLNAESALLTYTESNYGPYVVTAVDDSPIPGESIQARLFQNYPNPFNPNTVISYNLPRAGRVQLDVYNIAGQFVRAVVDVRQEQGLQTAEWDGRNNHNRAVGSGVYFYRLKVAEQVVDTKKCLLLK